MFLLFFLSGSFAIFQLFNVFNVFAIFFKDAHGKLGAVPGGYLWIFSFFFIFLMFHAFLITYPFNYPFAGGVSWRF